MKRLLTIIFVFSILFACTKAKKSELSLSDAGITYSEFLYVTGISINTPYQLQPHGSYVNTAITDTIIFNADSSITEIAQGDTINYPIFLGLDSTNLATITLETFDTTKSKFTLKYYLWTHNFPQIIGNDAPTNPTWVLFISNNAADTLGCEFSTKQ